MVSVLAFYSDDPSLNPTEVYNFSVKLLLKITKINKKEAGVGPFLKNKTRILPRDICNIYLTLVKGKSSKKSWRTPKNMLDYLLLVNHTSDIGEWYVN